MKETTDTADLLHFTLIPMLRASQHGGYSKRITETGIVWALNQHSNSIYRRAMIKLGVKMEEHDRLVCRLMNRELVGSNGNGPKIDYKFYDKWLWRCYKHTLSQQKERKGAESNGEWYPLEWEQCLSLDWFEILAANGVIDFNLTDYLYTLVALRRRDIKGLVEFNFEKQRCCPAKHSVQSEYSSVTTRDRDANASEPAKDTKSTPESGVQSSSPKSMSYTDDVTDTLDPKPTISLRDDTDNNESDSASSIEKTTQSNDGNGDLEFKSSQASPIKSNESKKLAQSIKKPRDRESFSEAKEILKENVKPESNIDSTQESEHKISKYHSSHDTGSENELDYANMLSNHFSILAGTVIRISQNLATILNAKVQGEGHVQAGHIMWTLMNVFPNSPFNQFIIETFDDETLREIQSFLCQDLGNQDNVKNKTASLKRKKAGLKLLRPLLKNLNKTLTFADLENIFLIEALFADDAGIQEDYDDFRQNFNDEYTSDSSTGSGSSGKDGQDFCKFGIDLKELFSF